MNSSYEVNKKTQEEIKEDQAKRLKAYKEAVEKKADAIDKREQSLKDREESWKQLRLGE